MIDVKLLKPTKMWPILWQVGSVYSLVGVSSILPLITLKSGAINFHNIYLKLARLIGS
jgi:hypothetical protein